MLALRRTVEHWRRLAQMYSDQCATLRGVAHQSELKAIQAQTLADCRQLEIDRLERVLAGQQPAETRGGFVNRLEPEPDESESESEDEGPAFSERLDEIFGVGLSAAEIEHRHESYRQRQIEALQAERAAILKELHGSP